MNTTNCQVVVRLIEQLPELKLEHVAWEQKTVTITLIATAPSSMCPRCNATSTSIHSRYFRRPRDLPLAGCAVHLRLAVRKFFCINPACSQRIFTERLVGFLTPYARCTTRLIQILSVIAFELGGRAGSRLAKRLAMTISASGLLRLIRRAPDNPLSTPRVLGVDDFALLKGRTYGTILVDLEHHRPVDLLPDRRAETVALWLQQHPGVQIITRDRSTEYSRGIAMGAPKALQVADRFHIVANLREALERQLERVHSTFVGIEVPRSQRRSMLSLGGNFASFLRQPEIRSAKERTVSELRRKGKRTIVGQVRALYAEGYSVRRIAQELELSRTTVYRYLRSDSPLIKAQRKIMPSILDEYVPYLSVRWQEGCENGVQLWREIKQRGYSGSCRMVTLWAAHQRKKPAKSTPSQYRTAEYQAKRAELLEERLQRAPSATLLSFLLLRETDSLNEDEVRVLNQVKAASSEAAQAYELTQRFMAMIHKASNEQLVDWMRQVKESKLVELQNFALGLGRDHAVVENALSIEYSNGQVEGQVNLLKLKKRAMFGRASFELLRKRVLYTG